MSTEPNHSPPNSQEAEQSVLGACLVDPVAVVKARGLLDPADFYHHAHEVIFGAILSLADSNRPVDPVTVSEQLRGDESLERAGGLGYLVSLARSVPTTSNAEAYAEIVDEKSRLRRMARWNRELLDAIYDGADQDAIQALLGDFNQVTASKTRSGPQQMDWLAFVREERAKADRGEEPYIATGFTDLDAVAPLVPGELTFLVGGSGDGKTSTAKAIANSIARRRPGRPRRTVHWYALEMSRTQLLQKFVAEEAGISLTDLRTHALKWTDWFAMEAAAKRLNELDIRFDVSPSVKMATMRRQVMAAKLRDPSLSVVILDHIGITGDYKAKNDRQDELLDRIAYEGKAMAKESNVHVLALAQGGLDNEKFTGVIRPTKRDIRSSRGMVQALDQMIYLIRPSKYPQAEGIWCHGKIMKPDDEKLRNVHLAYVVKNRMGEDGHIVPFYWPDGTGKILPLARDWPWQSGAEIAKPAAEALPKPPDPHANTGLE